MSEFEDAIKLANKVLDTPYRDPDDDLSVLARQFLRSVEHIGNKTRAASPSEWQPIESAPKYGTKILVWNPDTNCPETAWHSDKSQWPWQTYNNGYTENWPKFWQPIAPPNNHNREGA